MVRTSEYVGTVETAVEDEGDTGEEVVMVMELGPAAPTILMAR
jgi:hypothetical protein